MAKAGNLWAVGFDQAKVERAAQVRDEIANLRVGRAMTHRQGCGSGCALSGRTLIDPSHREAAGVLGHTIVG